ncbi:MAG: TonB-dependent receptor [Thermoanaerobaculia bacterium]
MRSTPKFAALFFLLLLVTVDASAQTVSGSIDGVVRDKRSGDPLPGVTVTVSSKELVAGTAVQVTDVAGRYRFPSLPVGTYEIKAELSGYSPAQQGDVRMSLGKVLTVNFGLDLPSVTEELTIYAEAPRVDVTSSQVSSVLTTEYIEKLPIVRSANDLVNYSPGVNDRQAMGGTDDSQNSYNLDGVDVSDPASGGYWILPNVDWLKEVQVAGLGANAEYGGFTGGLFNMVTKSGGNELLGTFSAYYSDDSLSNENSPDPDNPDLSPFTLDEDADMSLSVGGAIQKDRLWFFVSGQEVRNSISPFGAEDTEDTDLSRYLGKLTFQANTNNLLYALIDYDGIYRDRRGISNTVLADASTDQESPNWSYNVTWESIIGSNNFLSMKVTGFDGADDRLPQNGSNTSGRNDVDSGIDWVNAPYTLYQDKSRATFDTSWTLYKNGWGGESSSHTFKFGLNYEDAKHDEFRTRNGGITYVDDSYYCDSLDDYFADPFCGVYSSDVGNEIFLESRTSGLHLYAQDSWRLSQFTINYGLRYTSYDGGFANTQDDVYSVDFIAPRIGGVWDVGAKGRTAVRAHYGRYYDGLAVYYFDREENAGAFTPLEFFDYNFDTGEYDIPAGVRTNSAALDANIDHPYMDQYVLGFDQQLGRNFSVGFDYVIREYRDIIAMVNTNDDYDELVAPNIPGVDPLPFYDLLSAPVNVITNPGDAYRDYDSLVFRFNRNYADGWLLTASVVWADLQGNTFSADGYVDEWEDRNGQTNANGNLPGFSEWEVKLSASYDLPWGFAVSGYYRFLSGQYWTPVVQVRGLLENDRPFVFTEERGSRQLPDRNNLDLRLSKEFEVGFGSIDLFVDVFNVTNEDTVLAVDDWYGTYRYDYEDHPAGSTFSARGAFEQPLDIEEPRQIRLGLRVSF